MNEGVNLPIESIESTESNMESAESDEIRAAREEFGLACMECKPFLYSSAMRLTSRHFANAEDLVQATFKRAIQYMDKFEPGTNLLGWLQKMLFNIFVNMHRSRTTNQKKERDYFLTSRLVEGTRISLHTSGPVFLTISRPSNPESTSDRAISFVSLRMRKLIFHCINPDGFPDFIIGPDCSEKIDLVKIKEIFETMLLIHYSSVIRDTYSRLSFQHAIVFILVDILDFSHKEAANLLGIPAGTVMSRLFRARDKFRKSAECQTLARAEHDLSLSDYPVESPLAEID